MSPYVPGKPIEELERELGIKNASKIASNENPLGPSPRVLEKLVGILPKINRYPDGAAHDLSLSLSRYLGVGPERLMLGNGSNELIVLLGQMILKPGDEVIFSDKSFFVYRLVTQSMEAKAVCVPMQDHTHDLQRFSKSLTTKTRMVFICNPNNPTGTFVPLLALQAFLKLCPKETLVVVDEAYYEYVEAKNYFESLRLIEEYPNLVVLRTFSKAFGLAGLRVGYGIGHPDLVSVYQRVRQPFNVNGMAMAAAEAALTDLPHMRKVVDLNRSMRQMLYDGLAEMGLKPIPTQTNFIYFEVPKADELFQSLLRKGIIVRPMGPQALRVTTGTETETENFLKTFGELIA
jgi:histidinol-phosphate aminotransferase